MLSHQEGRVLNIDVLNGEQLSHPLVLHPSVLVPDADRILSSFLCSAMQGQKRSSRLWQTGMKCQRRRAASHAGASD